MTRNDIIRMAREAGGTEMEPYDYGARPDRFIMRHEVLVRFAALVAAAEREACAKVCEKRAITGECYVEGSAEADGCAAAIRARGNA